LKSNVIHSLLNRACLQLWRICQPEWFVGLIVWIKIRWPPIRQVGKKVFVSRSRSSRLMRRVRGEYEKERLICGNFTEKVVGIIALDVGKVAGHIAKYSKDVHFRIEVAFDPGCPIIVFRPRVPRP